MRASTNISLKERRALQLTDFKGVDFSSSALRVQSNRASGMTNFINEYGVNKKRNGWNELFKITDANGSPQRINGIFWYSYKERHEVLVHAGKRFYRISKDDSGTYSYTDITLSSTYAPSKCKLSLIKDQRSQAFFNKGRAYIVGCGDYLVYGSWDNGSTYELRRVFNNIDTYIPTTTISIDDDSVVIDDEGNNIGDIRSTLDDINMMTSRRKNQLLGSSSANKTWTLDSGSIDSDTDVNIVVETLSGDDAVTINISNSGTDKTKLYNNETSVEVGSVDFTQGKITLTIITTPQIENRDNIFVTFEHTVEGYTDRITNCEFGILFGINGNTDRLFVSGNSDYPNIDFYSEADDYTYFSDMNTSAMGSDSVAIKAYARLSDSTLVIYKEENGQEASIFYRTGTYQQSYDENGNLEIKGVFPTSAGAIGEGVISRYACVNFGGDNIILSQNGVFGIVLANNVATTERYTRERSRSINEKLKQHKNLAEAVGIVYKNKYYLSVDNVCYVADARFKYVSEDDLDNSFNYEWWYWDNIPARVWANIDNELYFGTEKGQVCVFDEKYTDREYYDCEEGDLIINTVVDGSDSDDVEDNTITYKSGISLSEGDGIVFAESGIYTEFLSNLEFDHNNDEYKIYVGDWVMIGGKQVSKIAYIYDGIEVYADNVENSGLQVNKPYYIDEVDKGEMCFVLTDSDGVKQSITSLGTNFRLCKKVTGKELYVTNVNDTRFQVKEYKADEEPLPLTAYNGTAPSVISAKIIHRKNVVASWYTPIFDMGTNESSKTLLKLTISTEPETNGKVSFGYETRSVNKLLDAKGLAVFSFEDFSFENFSFDTDFATSYSVKILERNFNFIIFRFISDNDANCAINSFTAQYKINKQNRGVR